MRILMVCLGNICRSPLAQGILESKLPDNYTVGSAGTAAYHVGNPPDSRSIAVAKQFGIDISNQRARQFDPADFENFDKIFAMDKANYTNLRALTNNKTHLDKISLFLDNVKNSDLSEVPDPYYGNESDFLEVFRIINDVTDHIAGQLI